MKSKEQTLLIQTYESIKSVNSTETPVSNEKVRVYIVVREDLDSHHLIFKGCFFSLSTAKGWISGMAYPENYLIKTYEGSGGKEIEIQQRTP